MKRWGGKMKPGLEVSRWLLQMRKESLDEPPLVVPKVIRQYTRKKKVLPADPENNLVTTNEATVYSEQGVSKIEVKEELIPDMNVAVENHVQIKKENSPEIKIMKQNAQEISLSKVADTVITKQENESKTIPSNQNVSNREQQQLGMDITVKTEPPDDSENTDLDQKFIVGGHMEESKAARIKPKTDSIKCDSYTSTEMDEDKILLTDEIDIKEEMELDNNDIELATVTNVKEEPAIDAVPVEHAKIMGLTNESLSPETQESEVCGKTPDLTVLKRCYLVAVNVAPSTSGSRRQIRHSRPMALLAADSQKVVDPENLAGFKVVAKSQIFTCDMCGDHFLSKGALKKHMRVAHTVATRYKCHCGARFSHNFMLLAHKRGHSGAFDCDICSKSLQSTQNFAHHLNTHLRERLFSCPICMRRFPLLHNLQRHVLRHQTSDVFQCNSCSASYRCITDLRRHSERDHGEKVDFPCPVCSDTLSSNAELIAHVKSHDNALHQCAFCSSRFTDVDKWEDHSAGHVERLDTVAPALLPYVCDVCRKRFEYRSALKTHVKCHTAERPYKCGECSKTFKTRSAMVEHEKGHERPYLCADCPARFAKRNSLSRHELLHSGVRPHVCPAPSCARAFTQRSAMLQHVQRLHTPGLKRAPNKAGSKLPWRFSEWPA